MRKFARVQIQSTIVQGRVIGADELASIRQLIAAWPDLSRYQLSRRLCQLWQWRTATGQLKDMSARSLLLKLEARGLIQLPARRWASPNRRRQERRRHAAHDTEPITGPLRELWPLQVRELSQWPQGLPLFEGLLQQYHYLGYRGSVGMNLKYLVCDRDQRALACLLFGSAAWKCASRDAFIGWDAPTRQKSLQGITNNSRFLILPWVRVPRLASYILSAITGRLRGDWKEKYAQRLSLVETFVEAARFQATAYRAANWICVGQTTGRTRQDQFHRIQSALKTVWVYPLSRRFRQELSA